MLWYDLADFPAYKICREGQVLSLKGREPRIMKRWVGDTGYWTVGLRQNGRYKYVKVHILLMRTFHGPCPPGHQVCHDDGNKLNINLSNLYYGTPSQNNFDLVRHGTHHEAARDRCDQGHLFTPENTMQRKSRNGNIVRKCKECHRITTARYRARKKAGLV